MARSLSGAEETSPGCVDMGGYLVAWEEPELFTDEFRAAVRSLR